MTGDTRWATGERMNPNPESRIPNPGFVLAFEGLDQSGKQTQAARLRAWFESCGRLVESLDFPDYATPIGAEIGRALRGERDFGPDVMQLLYVANRFEWKPNIEVWTAGGRIVICDRYTASSVAYGEAQGLDPAWLTSIQTLLPPPRVTVLLDIAPEVAAARKAANRDRFERDLDMLARVRQSYLRQASAGAGWLVVEAARDIDAVAADVTAAVARELQGRGAQG
ncbi:MAG: dTMP kinase [Acidobacteriota bacterium]